MALITCENVAFAYDGNVVTDHLNFTVNAGDCLCIAGENGSGKSTLVKGLLGLKQPQQGFIRFGDGLRPTEIGCLPQQTPVQKDFPAGVQEVVLSGCQNRLGLRSFYSKADRQRARSNLERVGAADLSRRCYRELSGGQQQRVLLARALCAATRLLLLDEPTAGLDPLITQEFYQLLQQLNQDLGMTVILVSHDLVHAVPNATHILHLQGRQVFFGTAEDYRASGVGRLYLGRHRPETSGGRTHV